MTTGDAYDVDYAWINGEYVEWENANVHIASHALHYGSGVFEGIRCYETEQGPAIFRMDAHMKRFYRSAHILDMEPPVPRDTVVHASKTLIQRNDLSKCYIRPIFFYGRGGIGLDPSKNEVEAAVFTIPFGTYLGEGALENGIEAKIASWQRIHGNALPTKAKATGQYVNSIMATLDAKQSGAEEAILLDANGRVAEGSGENLFIVRNGELLTPPTENILEGITRASVIQIAEDNGYTVTEQVITRDQLYTAEEAFFAGTAAEITPIRAVDNRTISDGRGPITEELQTRFFDAVHGRSDEYRDWLTPVTA